MAEATTITVDMVDMDMVRDFCVCIFIYRKLVCLPFLFV